MKKILILLLIISIVSCKKEADQYSNLFAAGKKLTELKEKELEEVSGLASSINNPGLLWTHNDSGNKAYVYLIDDKLDIKLICKLQGIKNRDWEDIAVGPGPVEGKNYIYIGDIGDNLAQFKYKYVYRFEEPILTDTASEVIITNVDTITLQLEDGVKDTETLMIDPTTKNLYLVSKREEPVYLYELKYPYATNDTLTAQKTIALPFTQMVAGEISQNGKEVLIKNYLNAYHWSVNDGETIPQALSREPAILNYTKEPQGEAITFAIDDSGFFTLSEKVKGEKTYLYFYPRSR